MVLILLIYIIFKTPHHQRLLALPSAVNRLGPNGIAVKGNYAYITDGDSGAGTILVFNVQNPSSPVLVGSNSADLSDEPQGITISGRLPPCC